MNAPSLGSVARSSRAVDYTEALRLVSDALALKERQLEHHIRERDARGVDMDREISDVLRRNFTHQLLTHRVRIAELELEMFELRTERMALRRSLDNIEFGNTP